MTKEKQPSAKGLLVQMMGTPMALGASIANGDEGIKFYFSGGYSF